MLNSRNNRKIIVKQLSLNNLFVSKQIVEELSKEFNAKRIFNNYDLAYDSARLAERCSERLFETRERLDRVTL